jgi:hypothetical protein
MLGGRAFTLLHLLLPDAHRLRCCSNTTMNILQCKKSDYTAFSSAMHLFIDLPQVFTGKSCCNFFYAI